MKLCRNKACQEVFLTENKNRAYCDKCKRYGADGKRYKDKFEYEIGKGIWDD